MVRLAVAISVSMLVSLGVAVAVWYGLNGVHKSGLYVFRVKTPLWRLSWPPLFLFPGTFVPMIRKIKFSVGASSRVAAQRESVAMTHGLIQQVPQIQVAPTIDPVANTTKTTSTKKRSATRSRAKAARNCRADER